MELWIDDNLSTTALSCGQASVGRYKVRYLSSFRNRRALLSGATHLFPMTCLRIGSLSDLFHLVYKIGVVLELHPSMQRL